MSPDLIVAEARRWVGTPYRHGASLRGVGCDCLGLVAGVLAELGRSEPVPHYAPDWAEASRRELLAEALEARLTRLDGVEPEPGDILLFRWRTGRPASHLGIATEPGRMVHAHARAVVAEVALGPAWERRVVGRYALKTFPT